MSSHNLLSSCTYWNNPVPLSYSIKGQLCNTKIAAATLHDDHEYCKPRFRYAPAGIKQPDEHNNNTKMRSFQMPLHYPRYQKSDYENMPEWKLDCLLKQYGLPVYGDVNQKRKFAMGAFLWPSQYE